MQSQSERLKVVAQNIANAEVTGKNPLKDPYRRIIYLTEHPELQTLMASLNIQTLIKS
ncbi:MAG: flagellar basal body protein [Candidatus Midichloria sp.]|nr:flagellar basal body protein [Candidatus Midichloria sp.]